MASGDSFLNWRKPWLVFVGTISRVGSKRFWKRICSCACYLKKVLSGALKTPDFQVWSRFPHFAVRVELSTERYSWIVLNAEPKWIPVDYEDNIHDPDLTCNAAPCTVFCRCQQTRSLKTYSLCACKKLCADDTENSQKVRTANEIIADCHVILTSCVLISGSKSNFFSSFVIK